MYKGLATVAGMTVLQTGDTLDGQIATLGERWSDFDYFFFHYKYTDSFGEDGDFDGKVGALEEIDAAIPAILDLEPEVIVVTGDHSSPATLSAHSWHPVPFAFLAKSMFPDSVTAFTERACAEGALGSFPAQQTFSLMLGYAGRLAKFGA
jgi:2,3-bisphosphoglycerate-independent phosphoglycerate mutase